MPEIWKFVAGFLLILVMGTLFDCIGQFTYQRKTLAEIKGDMRRTVMRISVLTIVMITASVAWYELGYLK